MHKILNLTIPEWVGIITIISFVFGGCAGLIRYFAKSISGPLNDSIKGLRDDLNEYRDELKRNEQKILSITDDHTKSIIEFEGRMNNVEIATNSNTLRIDKILERN